MKNLLKIGILAMIGLSIIVSSLGNLTQAEEQICNTTIKSDTDHSFFKLSGLTGKAVETYDENPSWTAFDADPSQKWIWSDEFVTNPSQGETVWFARSFYIPSDNINEAKIQIAADNAYVIHVNGIPTYSDSDSDNTLPQNFTAAGMDSYDIKDYLKEGANVIAFEVSNKSSSTNDPKLNPAGLSYILNIKSVSVDGCKTPNQKPQIMVIPDVITVNIGDFFNPMIGAIANDLEDGDLSSAIQINQDSFDVNVAGTYNILYTVTDSDGLKASTSRKLIVTDDQVIQDGSVCLLPEAPNRTIIDLKNNRLRSHQTVNQATGELIPFDLETGNYKVWLQSYDGYQNRINVSQPKEAFVLNFLNSSKEIVATSNQTTDLTDNVVSAYFADLVNDSLTISQEISYVQAYHPAFVDSNPNSVVAVCAAIEKVSGNGGGPVNNKPVITVNPETIEIEVGTEFDPKSSVTANDNEDGDLTANIVVGGNFVNTNNPGTFTITYNVSDSSGVPADQKTRTVIVKPRSSSGNAKINVCYVLADQFGNIVADSVYSNGFKIKVGDIVPSRNNGTEFNFTLPLNLNSDLIGNDGINDSECRTIDNLEIGKHYSYAESINDTDFPGFFNDAKYNDLFSAGLTTYDDFFVYSPELFDNDATNDNSREFNSDGGIFINSSRPERTLVVYHELNNTVENTRPVITLRGQNPLIINVGETYQEPGADVDDLEDGDIDGNLVIDNFVVSTDTPGIYHVVYNAADSQGLFASSKIRTVVVQNLNACTIMAQVSFLEIENSGDGDALPLLKAGENALSIYLDEEWFPVVFNNQIIVDQFIENYIDFRGLAVERRADNKLRFGLFGGHTALESGFSGTERVKGIISLFNADILNTNSINGENGLESNDSIIVNNGQVTFDLNVEKASDIFDLVYSSGCEEVSNPTNNAPVITVNPEIVNLIVGSDAPNFKTGVTANDQEDGNVTDWITVSGTVNTTLVGEYTITYNVSDSKGLAATPKTRVYRVSPGLNITGGTPINTRPVIVLKDKNPIQLVLGETYTEPGAIANDAEDGQNLPVTNISGTVDTNTVGTYQIKYNFSDSQGLAAVEVIRSVVVGQVSGEAIDISTVPVFPNCELRFTEWLRLGSRGEEVKDLQNFLNQHMNAGLKEDGVFGPATDKAVRNFQVKYREYVLTPWGLNNSTGWFYKTTRMLANLLTGCAEEPKFLEFVGKTWQTKEEFIGFIEKKDEVASLPNPRK